MIVTEREAGARLCPLLSNHPEPNCRASSCMAWRYVSPPKLEIRRTISFNRAWQIVNNLHPFETVPKPQSDSEYLVAEKFMETALKENAAITSILTGVTEDWVCTNGPAFDKEEMCLYAEFTRAFDDTATGYCGMAATNGSDKWQHRGWIMKMAKASEADLNMAMTLANYCDSINRTQMPDALSKDSENIEWLDSDDCEQYARLLHGLQELLDQGSISRVIWGMAVVCNPSNQLIDPAADTLEHHPIRQQMENALLWTLYHHQGGSSPIGQPIRKLLGIGQYDRLTDEQIATAKEFGEGKSCATTPPPAI